MASQTEMAPTEVFIYKGVMLVPHYRIAGAFVGPGAKRYYTRELLIAYGAKASVATLWVRDYANTK